MHGSGITSVTDLAGKEERISGSAVVNGYGSMAVVGWPHPLGPRAPCPTSLALKQDPVNLLRTGSYHNLPPSFQPIAGVIQLWRHSESPSSYANIGLVEMPVRMGGLLLLWRIDLQYKHSSVFLEILKLGRYAIATCEVGRIPVMDIWNYTRRQGVCILIRRIDVHHIKG